MLANENTDLRSVVVIPSLIMLFFGGLFDVTDYSPFASKYENDVY